MLKFFLNYLLDYVKHFKQVYWLPQFTVKRCYPFEVSRGKVRQPDALTMERKDSSCQV